MKAESNSLDDFHITGSPALKVATIYEDFASGTRAKFFAERLSERLGCASEFSHSIWRSDLFAQWPIANAATRAAAECDYIIVSLRGDRILPQSARQWIEDQLDGAALHEMALIVLSDSSQGKWRVVEGTRHYLRCACLTRSVPFFSHVVTPAPIGAATRTPGCGETPELALDQQRWLPALVEA